MAKRHGSEPKRQGGISLPPELWKRIDEAASIAGVPRNRVMETILLRAFGLVPDSHKSSAIVRNSEATLPEGHHEVELAAAR